MIDKNLTGYEETEILGDLVNDFKLYLKNNPTESNIIDSYVSKKQYIREQILTDMMTYNDSYNRKFKINLHLNTVYRIRNRNQMYEYIDNAFKNHLHDIKKDEGGF